MGVGRLPACQRRSRADPARRRRRQPHLPASPGALPDRYTGFDDDINEYPAFLREHPIESLADIPHLADGLRGLEDTRRIDLEDWMTSLGLDAVIFPAVADVGPSDMDVNPLSADLGWRNGVWVANGNLAIRHLGIPTVTVPMGTMTDIGMPVGLTFAGRAYDDVALLGYAAAFEALGSRRTPRRSPHPCRDLGAPSAVTAGERADFGRQTTMLTRRPATTMTFFGLAPARNAATFSSASAAARARRHQRRRPR